MSRGPWAFFTWPLTTCGAIWGETCERGVRTSIAFWAGVWVVHLGTAGLVRRLAMGDPFGAICCGVGACELGALPRVGDVGLGLVMLPCPPPLPPPRGLERLRPPRSARDSKLTIRVFGENWGGCEFASRYD